MQDLAALAIPNLSQPTPHLLCAGQLDPRHFAALAARGFKSFISLRPAHERGAGWEEAHAPTTGVQFQRLPIASAADINEAAARALSSLLERQTVPTVLYCGSSNRVGGLLALAKYHVEDASAAEALEFGRAAGLTTLEPYVRQLLELDATDAH